LKLNFLSLVLAIFDVPEVARPLPERLTAVIKLTYVRPLARVLVLMLYLVYFEGEFLTTILA
jgi:hypothetical protein